MLSKSINVGPYQCGPKRPLLLIAGPCVLEDLELTMLIARQLKRIAVETGVNLVFKASFDKANRTSIRSFRGPGMAGGLQMLDTVRAETRLPIVTDIHEPNQASPVGEVCELIQIPAFLCRQTDLLLAAAKTGRALMVKKGQFLAPRDMKHVVEKLREAEAKNVILCERGTFFGYGRLVNDMRSLPEMRALGVPVAFDATHSVQEPGGLDGKTGGNRQMVEPLARAAIAVGVDALFFETHPSPAESPSDGPNMVPLDEFGDMIARLTAMRSAIEVSQHSAAA